MDFGNCRYLAAGALVFVGVAAGTPAHSQSPMEFWIQEQSRATPRYDAQPRYRERWNGGWSRTAPGQYHYFRSYAPEERYQEEPYQQETHEQKRYQPVAKVKSPDYRSYTPDTPTLVALDKICQLQVASSTGGTPSAAATSFAAACAVSPDLKLRTLPEVGEALKDYYSGHPQFVWIDNGAVGDKARAVMASLALSARYGLEPDDYRVALPPAATGDTGTDLEALMHFELALSAKVMTYVLDATRGRIDPNRMSDYYDLPRRQIDLVAVMSDITKTEDVVQYLDSRNPDNPYFRALVEALAKARKAMPRQPIVIPAETFIRPGDSDPSLPQVVAAIERAGSKSLQEKHTEALAAYDGSETYDPKAVALVRDFQAEQGLKVDGIIGSNTIDATRQATTAAHLRKLTLALERMRWLPRQLGPRYVLLNQPAFQVKFVKGDGETVTMRAIVGKPTNQTYFFTDTIESVEYNPYWNVPRSIIINEMLPHLYNDPSYLDRQGYEVTDSRGRKISSSDVDWGAYARKKISVDVRQPPGRRNALGVLKIEFPNRHAIYMHDTPQKHLFKNQQLAYSHGCVRLEHPPKMAAALLGQPVSYVEHKIAEGRNASDEVGNKTPVYLTYFTAWPDSDGKVHYYDDVYGRDRHLSDALAKTEAVRARSGS